MGLVGGFRGVGFMGWVRLFFIVCFDLVGSLLICSGFACVCVDCWWFRVVWYLTRFECLWFAGII